MLYSFLDVVLGILFKIFLRLEVHGAENIPKTGPLVIASNHLSLLDPPVIGVAAPRKVHFMAKRELFVPVLGYIYKTLGAFPVNRGGADRAAIKHGIEILQSGEVLAIFPEGTRSKTSGTDIKRCGRLWPKVVVKFGTPVPFPPVGLNKEVLQDLTDKLTADIKALQGVK